MQCFGNIVDFRFSAQFSLVYTPIRNKKFEIYTLILHTYSLLCFQHHSYHIKASILQNGLKPTTNTIVSVLFDFIPKIT